MATETSTFPTRQQTGMKPEHVVTLPQGLGGHRVGWSPCRGYSTCPWVWGPPEAGCNLLTLRTQQ